MYIEGSIEYRSWQDREGQTRYTTEITARELILLSRPGRRRGVLLGAVQGRGRGAPRPRARTSRSRTSPRRSTARTTTCRSDPPVIPVSLFRVPSRSGTLIARSATRFRHHALLRPVGRSPRPDRLPPGRAGPSRRGRGYRTRRRLPARFPGVLRISGVPGLSMAVVRDGRVVWAGAFGTRNDSAQTPVDTATVFEAASLSKPVFAYLVLRLADRGELDLDRPLAEMLGVSPRPPGRRAPGGSPPGWCSRTAPVSPTGAASS